MRVVQKDSHHRDAARACMPSNMARRLLPRGYTRTTDDRCVSQVGRFVLFCFFFLPSVRSLRLLYENVVVLQSFSREHACMHVPCTDWYDRFHVFVFFFAAEEPDAAGDIIHVHNNTPFVRLVRCTYVRIPRTNLWSKYTCNF